MQKWKIQWNSLSSPLLGQILYEQLKQPTIASNTPKFMCVRPKSKELLSMSVAGNFLLLEGQVRLRSSGIDAARVWCLVILDLVFISYWVLGGCSGDSVVLQEQALGWLLRRTGQTVKIGARVDTDTSQIKRKNSSWGSRSDGSVAVENKYRWGDFRRTR